MQNSVGIVSPGEITDLCAQKHAFGALIAFFYPTVETTGKGGPKNTVKVSQV